VKKGSVQKSIDCRDQLYVAFSGRQRTSATTPALTTTRNRTTEPPIGSLGAWCRSAALNETSDPAHSIGFAAAHFQQHCSERPPSYQFAWKTNAVQTASFVKKEFLIVTRSQYATIVTLASAGRQQSNQQSDKQLHSAHSSHCLKRERRRVADVSGSFTLRKASLNIAQKIQRAEREIMFPFSIENSRAIYIIAM
jgi:hypothetical protein